MNYRRILEDINAASLSRGGRILSLVFGLIYLGLGIGAFALWDLGNKVEWVGVILAAIFAVLLYWFRCVNRSAYGVVEIGIGLTLAYSSYVKIAGTGTTSLLAFVTGVYFTVRGIDNFLEGAKKKSTA